MRKQVAAFLEKAWVTNFIIGVILFNAILLGLETSDPVMARVGGLVLFLDQVCLAIFVVEIALKLFAHGWRFFKSGWNLFDFFIVAIGATHSAGLARYLRNTAPAPCGRRVHYGPAGHGQCVSVDVADLLHWCRYGDQAVRQHLSRVVWRPWAIRLFAFPDHDA